MKLHPGKFRAFKKKLIKRNYKKKKIRIRFKKLEKDKINPRFLCQSD